MRIRDQAYKKEAKSYFKKQVNASSNIIKDLKFVNSKSDNLIQLADMIAGSLLRSTQTDKRDSQEYLRVIERRIEDTWNFK